MQRYAPPWREPYFVGVAGCSGSGKTTITRELVQRLNVPHAVLLSMDNFYRPLGDEDRQLAFRSEYDFDHPRCVDFELLVDVLSKLKRGERADIPIYSFHEHNRTQKSVTLYGANIVFVEGIYALYDSRVVNLLDLKVFINEDYDVCMARRLCRDIASRGRDVELAIKQWHAFVKPNYLSHILPTAKCANMLVPKGALNNVAINALFSFLKENLERRSAAHLNRLLLLGREQPFLACECLPESNQVKCLLTTIFDKSANRQDFVFATDRLARIVVSAALDDIAFADPRQPKVAAVTLVRGGECFESALREVLPTVYLGRLLILSDTRTGEPRLHLCRLPTWIGVERHPVLLTTAEIASGAAAVMAIAVLRDHGVAESDIVLCAFEASNVGARRIRAAFPEVRVLVAHRGGPSAQLDIDGRYYGTS